MRDWRIGIRSLYTGLCRVGATAVHSVLFAVYPKDDHDASLFRVDNGPLVVGLLFQITRTLMPAVGSMLWQATSGSRVTHRSTAISVVTPRSRFFKVTHFTQFGMFPKCQLFAPQTDKPLTHNVAASRLVTSCRRLS